jgi:16S rRNA (adenine1518-N6/adenine1519-N6)-dimethyltransferase
MTQKKEQFIQQHPDPKRKFSQNFLVNEKAIKMILKALGDVKSGTLIECGVGKGAITLPLAKKYPKRPIVGIDIDSRCIRHTESLLNKSKVNNVKLLETDLCGDTFFHEISDQKYPLSFIGNLPYHIASQVLLRVIQFWPHTHKMVFMFQKEFAERLRASPSEPTFGKLSVLFQSYYDLKKVISLEPDSFYPRPEVQSEVLVFTPLKKPAVKYEHIMYLSKFLGMAFMHRRKTLRYNLKLVLGPRHLDVVKNVLSKDGITLDHRAEIVPVSTWGAISEALIN